MHELFETEEYRMRTEKEITEKIEALQSIIETIDDPNCISLLNIMRRALEWTLE
jgi:hypothetical protein